MTHAWSKNPELKKRLEIAGWRYAQLIGVVDLKKAAEKDENKSFEKSYLYDCVPFIEQDRQAFGHFIKTATFEGQTGPLWDDDDATAFIAEIAAVDENLAAEWLEYDWKTEAVAA